MKKFLEYIQLDEEIVSLPSDETHFIDVKIGHSDYRLESADTPQKIQEGLSGRDCIPRKTGMLFVMPKQSIQEFWMKGCNTDMDILFLDEEGMVVNMERMIKERSKASFETETLYENRLRLYSSKYPAKYAIEIPAGDITRLGIHIGDNINISTETEE